MLANVTWWNPHHMCRRPWVLSGRLRETCWRDWTDIATTPHRRETQLLMRMNAVEIGSQSPSQRFSSRTSIGLWYVAADIKRMRAATYVPYHWVSPLRTKSWKRCSKTLHVQETIYPVLFSEAMWLDICIHRELGCEITNLTPSSIRSRWVIWCLKYVDQFLPPMYTKKSVWQFQRRFKIAQALLKWKEGVRRGRDEMWNRRVVLILKYFLLNVKKTAANVIIHKDIRYVQAQES